MVTKMSFNTKFVRLGNLLFHRSQSRKLFPLARRGQYSTKTLDTEATSAYVTRGATNQMLPRPDHVVWPNQSGTWSSGPLSKEQLDEYDKNGFIVLEEIFSKDEIEKYLEIADIMREKFQEEISRKGDVRVTEDSRMVTEVNGKNIRSIFESHKREFQVLSTDPRLVSRAKQILSDDVYITQSRLNFQSAFNGRGFEWHQDFETWHAEDGMPRPRALSCVVYLMDAMPQNGALMVIPRSHMTFISCAGETPENHWTQSLQRQEYGMPSRELVTTLANKHDIKHCTGPAGSLLIFDCNLLHGSHSNISPWGRTNLFLVYNSFENKFRDPFYSRWSRPEHIATKDPAWVKPI